MADLPSIQVPMASRKVAQNPNAMPLIGSIPTAPVAPMQRRVAMNPIAVPTAPQIRQAPPVSAYQPVAAATNAYEEAGDPFTAFAQGWTNASSARDTMAEDVAEKMRVEAEGKAARDQAAALIREQFPGQESLARGVEIGAWDADSALRQAADFTEQQTATSSAQSEAAEIESYLRSNGHDDIADQFTSGVLDVDGVAAALVPKAPEKAPSSYRYKDDGVTLEPIPGGPDDPANKPPKTAEFNVSQATAAGFADRMIQSDALIAQPELAAVQTDRSQQIKAGTPFFGNDLVSSEYRRATQAQSDFINALMRRESGAVIGEDEFENARKQYFPAPGDDADTLQQKAANRRNAITGVSRSAGPAYTAPDTTNYLTGDVGGASPAGPAASPTGPASDAITATNPETGETLKLVNGEWVPM